jgi:hypothetical protein
LKKEMEKEHQTIKKKESKFGLWEYDNINLWIFCIR